MDAVMRLRPERIVYISCNPETLARDLEYLTGKGVKKNVVAGKQAGSGRMKSGKSGMYRVQEITPVDMFPYTEEIEVVCLLTKTP